MNRSIKARIAAFFASVLVTFASFDLMAEYGYPEAHSVTLAWSPR